MSLEYSFADLYIDATKSATKIPQSEYEDIGSYPIIDQGNQFIAGRRSSGNGVFTEVPAIIFGDHTRAIKFVTEPFFIGADGVKVLLPKNKNDNTKYLYYALSAARIPSLGYSRHFKVVKELKFEYHDRLVQDEIVTNLEKIDAIIHLRKEELSNLDQLIKSRFFEMFGDPVANPYGWPTKSLLDMGYCKNGMNFHTGDNGVEIHCLGVGDFKSRSVIDRTDNLPLISLNEYPPEKYLLQDDDIVFVRSNGNKALVGRCLAVYPHNIPTTYSGFCIRYRRTSNNVITQYLLGVLKMDSMRKLITGKGANIQNLNQQILAALNIPIPPRILQEHFAAFVQKIAKSKSTIQQSLNELQILKKSLMQTYFG